LEIKLAGQAVRGKRFCEFLWSAQAGCRSWLVISSLLAAGGQREGSFFA
jgi:hypothetical protein